MLKKSLQGNRKRNQNLMKVNRAQGDGSVDKVEDCCVNEGAGVQIPKTNVLDRQGGHLLGHPCLGETKTWYPQGKLTS